MTKAASFAISTKGIDGEMGGDTSAAAGLKKEAAHCPTAARLKYILRLLMQYARFLLRAKGDVEAAALVYRRAAEVGCQTAALNTSCIHPTSLTIDH